MSVDSKFWDIYAKHSRKNNGSSSSLNKRKSQNSNICKIKNKAKRRKLVEVVSEQQMLSEAYTIMIKDEQIYPASINRSKYGDKLHCGNLRLHNPETNYLSEVINVYKFYFDEIRYNLNQRKQTLYLAMAYFTQTIMRCPCLQKSEIGIIASSALLLASKFDEIDYSLPSIKKIKKQMDNSFYFEEYDKDFTQCNFVSCEKEICKRLDWNFNQSTSYHFFENLVNQGIFDKDEKVGSNSLRNQTPQTTISTSSSTNMHQLSSGQTSNRRTNSLCKQDSIKKNTLCK